MTVNTTGSALAAITGTTYDDLNGNGQRDSTVATSNGVSPINLQLAGIANTPYALDYHQPTNSMMIFAQDSNNNAGIYRILPDGSELLYANLPGLSLGDGGSMSTVRSGNTAGFTTGDIYVAGIGIQDPSNPYNTLPNIIKLTDGKATVLPDCVTLNDHGVVQSLVVDQTGNFGDKLLALVQNGDLWEINADGTSTLLTSQISTIPMFQGENGLLPIPNNPSLYGPADSGGMAGQLLILTDS